MSRRTATLQITVTYDDERTDDESLATAADRLLETALSTPGITDDYGEVNFGSFEVAIGPDVEMEDVVVAPEWAEFEAGRLAIRGEDGQPCKTLDLHCGNCGSVTRHVEHASEDQPLSACLKCGEVNTGTKKEESRNQGDTQPSVICAVCGEAVPAPTAHLHQGRWIGDACCWDERLRSSE